MQYPAIWHSILAVFIFNDVSGRVGQFTAGSTSVSAS
jgi:hypothetical protein